MSESDDWSEPIIAEFELSSPAHDEAKGAEMKCTRVGCEKDATCAVGVAFYPMKALMAYYKTDQPLSRIVLTMVVCDDDLPPDPAELLGESLKVFADTIQASSGTAVDLPATRVVRIELTDPDYLRLLADRDAAREQA